MRRMLTATSAQPKPLPSVIDRFPPPAPQEPTATTVRKVGFLPTLLAAPAAYALGRLLGGHRTGMIAGGIALFGLGAVRWQLARWFAESPAYGTLGRAGQIELRRYPAHLEARSDVEGAHDLEVALEKGYSRLECFLFGANADRAQLPEVTPVLTSLRDGVYSTSFVLRPHHGATALPAPADARVQLGEVSARQVAVFPFRGRYTKENFFWQERKFLRALVDAGVATRGSVTLATYDSPTVLPALRKNELWIEVA
jgi:SOUL heme-binding protein